MTYADAALLKPGDHVVLDIAENMQDYGFFVVPDMLEMAGRELVVRDAWDQDETDDETGEVIATHRCFSFEDFDGNAVPFFWSNGTIDYSPDYTTPLSPATESELTDFLLSEVGL